MRLQTLSFGRGLAVVKPFVLIGVLMITALAQSGGVDETFNAVPELDYVGTIQFTLQADDKILVFGSFQIVNGVVSEQIVRLNPDGTRDSTFQCTTCDFNIGSAALQPDGKIIIAGTSPLSPSSSAPRIYRLNPDGSRDTSFSSPFQPNPIVPQNPDVRTVQPDGKILVVVSTSFTGPPGAFRSSILYRLTTTGALDSTFMPITVASSSGFSSGQTPGKVLVLPDGKILAATNSYSCPLGCTPGTATIKRYNSDGTLDPTYESPTATVTQSPPLFIPGGALFLDEVILPDGSMIVVGLFTSINGVSRSNIAKILPAGNVDLTFQAVNVGQINRIAAVADGKFLISTTEKLYRLNSDGSNDESFSSPAGITQIKNWELDSTGNIILYGTLSDTRKFIRLDENGGILSSFEPRFGVGASIRSVGVQPDGKVLLSGNFIRVNNVPRVSIVRVNADGDLDTTFDAGAGFNNTVTKIVVQTDGKALVIGDFSSFDGTALSSPIARLNIDGSLDSSFQPVISPSSTIRDVAVDSTGKVLIGGNFSSVDGQTPGGLARLNADGTVDAAFAPMLGTPFIFSIEVLPDGKIVVGGEFNGVNGFNRKNLVRLEPDGALDPAFNASNTPANNIRVLQVEPTTNGKYFVFLFDNTLIRLNNDGSLDPSFASLSISADHILSQADGSVIIAGSFTNVNGVDRSNIVRLSPNGNLDTLFLPLGANGPVRTLSSTGGGFIAGGDFSMIGGVTRLGIARLLTNPFRVTTSFDFEGDGRADIAVFRPANGYWYEQLSSTGSFVAQQFGIASDRLAAADYDGDGRTDVAVFRDVVPGAGDLAYFYITNSNDGSIDAIQFGSTGDVPVSGDWDGDGKADLAVYRSGAGSGVQSYFYYRPSGTPNVNFRQIVWGAAGDKPVVGDFDGDGKLDAAVFRPSNSYWYVLRSSNGQIIQMPFGLATDIPAAADYDGDGVTSIAVFRPSTGVWYTSTDPQANYGAIQFGTAGDMPIPADYDGDGKDDIAVFRPSTGVWYLMGSTSGFTGVQFGVSGDKPIPGSFIP